jgi:hypothetical protein
MLKAIAGSLYDRVFVAYKSTLIGLGLVAADVVVSNLQTAALPQWAHALVGVVAAVLTLYKGKASAPQPTPTP